MAISSTRFKFLDQETKVLVKPIKDFTSNEIFTNAPPLLGESELLKGVQLGAAQLKSVQGSVQGVMSLVDDVSATKFALENLLTNAVAQNPSLMHLDHALTQLKALDKKSVKALMGGMLQTATVGLLNNPSVLNAYKAVSENVRVKNVVNALGVFSALAGKGELNLSGVSQSLLSMGEKGEELDMTRLSGLLATLNANNTSAALQRVVGSQFELPSNFFDELLSSKERQSDEAEGVFNNPAEVGLELPIDQEPDVGSLLIAYLTIKRAHTRVWVDLSARALVQDITINALGELANRQAVLAHFVPRLSRSVVSMVYAHNALLTYLRGLFSALQDNAVGANPLESDALSSVLDFVQELMQQAYTHPFFVDMDAVFSSVFNPQAGVFGQALERVRTGNFDLVEGFAANDFTQALRQSHARQQDRLLVRYTEQIRRSQDPEDLGVSLLTLRYQSTLALLRQRSGTLASSHAALWLGGALLDSVFEHQAGETLTPLGFFIGQRVLHEEDTSRLNGLLVGLYRALNASVVMRTPLADVPLDQRSLHSTLRVFVHQVDAQIGGPLNLTWLDQEDNVVALAAAFVEDGPPLASWDTRMFPISLDRLDFTQRAVELDRITFSGDRLKIV